MIIPKNNNILKYLQQNKVNIMSPCNGQGICGKCKVLIHSKPKPNKQELSALSSSELDQGIRLACSRNVLEDIDVEILNEQLNMKITSSFTTIKNKNPYIKLQKDNNKYNVYRGNKLIKSTQFNKAYGVAVDIGTTTVVVTLNDLIGNHPIDIVTFLNPQSKFGADVISRIQYAGSKEGLDTLSQLITTAIDNSIETLLSSNKIEDDCLYEVVVAANNTMVHLLLHIDPTALALSPYKSNLLQTIETRYGDVFDNNRNATLTIIGGFDSYVGGDIVSGIYSENLHKKETYNLLVDLGTNGEIVLIKNDRAFATSTAAGPAFEGVNIFCGIGAVEGAINTFKYPKDITTINNKEAIGICGSGLIDIVSELVQNDIIDFSGRMKGSFNITKDIVLTPNDIREVQLAKAAIRAGVEHLLLDAKVSNQDIDTVYIAGGFGKYVDLQHFFNLGIIPMDLYEKVQVIGNSSVRGAVKYLYRPLSKEIESIRLNCEIIQLGTSSTFQDLFVANMHFNGKK